MELLVLIGSDDSKRPSSHGFNSLAEERTALILGQLRGVKISPEQLQGQLNAFGAINGLKQQNGNLMLDERTMTALNEVARDKNLEAAMSGNLTIMGADAATKNALAQINEIGREAVSATVESERLRDQQDNIQTKQKATVESIRQQIEDIRNSGGKNDNRVGMLKNLINNNPNIPADIKGSLVATLNDLDDDDVESPKKGAGNRRAAIASKIAGRKAGLAMHEAIQDLHERMPELKDKFSGLTASHEAMHEFGNAAPTTPLVPGFTRGGKGPNGP